MYSFIIGFKKGCKVLCKHTATDHILCSECGTLKIKVCLQNGKKL